MSAFNIIFFNIYNIFQTLQYLRKRHAETPLTQIERTKVSRVRNAVYALSQVFLIVSPESISKVYQASIDADLAPKDMILPENMKMLTASLLN